MFRKGFKFMWWTAPMSLVACDSPVSSGHNGDVAITSSAFSAARAPAPGIEEVFDSIGREIPGFAGFYVNSDGVLVARLKDGTQATKARTVLREIAWHKVAQSGDRQVPT